MSTSVSPMQSIYEDESEEVDATMKGQVAFLMGAFGRLNTEQAVTNSSVSAMEGKMTSLEAAMTNLASSVQAMIKSQEKKPIQVDEQCSDSSLPSSQVHRPFSDRNRSVSRGSRGDDLNLGNRESMLKKVEMPMCDGSKISEWIADIEYFYTLGRYGDEAKLDLVPLCLQGALKKWYAWVMNRGGFRSWRDFINKMLVRFSESIDDEPATRLFAIKQTGTVTEYVSEFEELSAQVPGVADHHLERIFYNGLSLEMKEVIKMKDPQGLSNFIAAVLRMETSAFCKVVGETRGLEDRPNSKKQSGGKNLGGSAYHKSFEKPRGDTSGSKENVPPKGALLRARQRYTDAELDAELRRDKLCFTCKAPWSRTHDCPNKEVRVLTVVNGCEMEIL